ncbi:MAG: YggT family protein [Frankiaceae bacterium]
MSPVGRLLSNVLLVFLLILIFRLVMEWVFQLSRSYRPTGFMSVVLEITYTITDPPLRLLRRIIPPLRIGGFALDLAFLVLFILISILRRIAATI